MVRRGQGAEQIRSADLSGLILRHYGRKVQLGQVCRAGYLLLHQLLVVDARGIACATPTAAVRPL